MDSRNLSHLDSLKRLRIQLTAWYAGTFLVILILLGGGLFLSLRHQFESQLDDSLVSATAELERAATIRALEAGTKGKIIDAVDELHIPDRALYLFDATGKLIKPDTAAGWIRNAAAKSGTRKALFAEANVAPDVTLKLYASPFIVRPGEKLVAIAVADKIEMEDKYSDLIAAFSAAAAFALILVAGGGWLLVRKSTAPVERSMEYMRRFMGDAAHELRTPISVARMQAEVALQNPRDAGTYQTTLRGILSETERIGRIVEDMLTLSRADAGERPISRTIVYLDDIVIEAANAARFLANAKGIDLRVEKFEEAPLLGDADLLRQLVMILLDNAIKFSPAGSKVGVCVGIVDGSTELEVDDQGPGIPAGQLPHIFERFFRGDVAREKTKPASDGASGQGAGLGLSIATWIAQAHHGSIAVHSVEGSGSRFTVRFPPAHPSSS